MVKVKTRKVGNALVVTIPASLEIKEGQEFTPEVDSMGRLILTPLEVLSSDEKNDIDREMEKYRPLMEKLKDR
ncbi:MAG: hypothetical protein LBM27_02990 [Lactobacillaceae bacterium]|nr:hypothetical protein [Lactobacillaceae bacterium]